MIEGAPGARAPTTDEILAEPTAALSDIEQQRKAKVQRLNELQAEVSDPGTNA